MVKLFMLLMFLVARLGNVERLLLEQPYLIRRLLEEHFGIFQRFASVYSSGTHTFFFYKHEIRDSLSGLDVTSERCQLVVDNASVIIMGA